MTQRILVVDDNAMNLRVVTSALAPAGYEVVTAQGGREALERVTSLIPDLIILDVLMPDINGYEVCHRMRRMAGVAQRPIMMLTANDSLEERVSGLEAGADDYMSKPFEPVELRARVHALLRRHTPVAWQAPTEQAAIIAVYSLRGGVGVSTLAVNLAVGLSQIWGCQTALVDLAFTNGQAALMLNLPMRTTWSDLARLHPDEIDNELIEKMLLPHPSGVHVLAAAARPEQAELISAAAVTRVLDLLRARFPYVVLDLPHDFSETTLAGLDASAQIMGVLAPEIAAVRTASSMIAVFEQLAYRPEQLSLVLNTTVERGLARKDIEAALKRPITMVIPYAPEPFVSALNRGVPPILELGTKPLGALLEDWAFGLSSEAHRTQRPTTPSPAWTRIAQRAQQRRGR